MGIFNRSKKANKSITLGQLKQQPYEQTYFDECKFIWKNYIPKTGQSEILQGELLRELEKLRYEAQNNGNINWNEDFSFFCDFIEKTLCAQTIYSDDEKTRLVIILSYIKDCGNYAMNYCDGQISDEEVDVEKIAYVADNLYDIIADAIGKFQANYPAPIPLPAARPKTQPSAH